MRITSKKITNDTWSYFFFLILLPPAALKHIGFIEEIFQFMHLMALALLIMVNHSRILHIRRSGSLKWSKIVICLVLYYLYLLITTVIHHGSDGTVFFQAVQFIAFAIYLEMVMKLNPAAICKSLLNILTAYLILNFVTILVMPGGLYATSYYTNNYLFGYDNQNVNFLLPAMILVIIKNECYKPCKIHVLLVYFISVATAIIIWSGMTLVVTVCMSAFAFFCLGQNSHVINQVLKGKWFNFTNMLLLNIAMCIGLVFFRIQDYFEYLIVAVLHKTTDLTSRTRIWERSISFIKQNLFWGYGKEIYQQRALKHGFRALHPAGLHAHNRFLETIYRGGVILGGIYLYMLFYTARRLKRIRDTKLAKILSFGIFIYMVGMLTEFYDYCILFFGLMVISEYAENLYGMRGNSSE